MTMDELREKIARRIAARPLDSMSLTNMGVAEADIALSVLKSATGLTDEDLGNLMSGKAYVAPRYQHRLPQAVADAFDALGDATKKGRG